MPQRRRALAAAPGGRFRRRPCVSSPQAYGPRKRPFARKVAMMPTRKRTHLTREEAMTVAIIENAVPVPVLAAARRLRERFQAMIRRGADPASMIGSPTRRPVPWRLSRTGSGTTTRRRGGPVTAMVQRSGRRPDHPAQAREGPDVRSRQARPPPGTAPRRGLSAASCAESESEPE